ncbi:MAG: hypothetical protein A2017_19590 [Lentisphaerae bacterium GWF2_44_16]|nr:MAG: hypothetical protein A2017_19590 [Lentisphaerae bacterium GWF2_44_16]
MSIRDKKTITFAMMIFAALLLGAAGASFFREYGRDYFISREKKPDANAQAILKWLDAMRKADMKKSLLMASMMTPDDKICLPEMDYLKLMPPLGLNSTILTDPFNRLDYCGWKDALELKELANSIVKNSDSPSMILYNAVINNIKIKSDYESLYPSFTVMEIWKNKSGSVLDRIRLFRGLANQAGLDVIVAGLLSKSGRLEHVLCEARSEKTVDTFDFTFDKVFSGLSVADLAKNSSVLPEKWPASLRKALQRKIVYMQPSEFQDYRLSNQKLASHLANSTISRQLPVFGASPKEALEKYIMKAGLDKENNIFGYWQFPLLAVKSFPEFPEKWLKGK